MNWDWFKKDDVFETSWSKSACSTILWKDLIFSRLLILLVVFGSSAKEGFATILFIRPSIISSFSSLLNVSGGLYLIGASLPPFDFD
jgi:hypothetical protein